jgi:hypothetical protein
MRFLLMITAAALLSCKGEAASGGLTEAQVQVLVTRMLTQRADAVGQNTPPRPGGGSATGADEAEAARNSNLVAAPCLSAAGQTSVRQTAALLVALDELMADYRPQAPTLPERPERCLTTLAAGNDPAAAQNERGRMTEIQAQRRAAQQQARQADTEFRSTRRIGYMWLANPSIDVQLRAAQYGCHVFCYAQSSWDDSCDRSCCRGGGSCQNWEIRTPAVVSTASDPHRELLRRLQATPSLRPSANQFCSVIEARASNEEVVLTCSGPRTDDSFRVRLPSAVGAAGGPLASVVVGDLVRFEGHTALWKKFDDRAPYWEFWRFETPQVSIAERSTCCAAPPTQAADAGVAAADAGGTGEPAGERRRHRRHVE